MTRTRKKRKKRSRGEAPASLFNYNQNQFFKFISYNFIYKLSIHTLAELKLVKKKTFMAKQIQKNGTANSFKFIKI